MPHSARRPAPRRSALLLALALLSAAPAAAQDAAARGPGASAELSVAVRSSRLLGGAVALVGASAGFRLGAVTFGGAGWALTGPVAVGGGPGADLELEAAYGGVRVHAELWRGERVSVVAGALVGAGNAKILLPAVRTGIAADNFGVVEPDLGARVRLGGPWAVALDAGYRFTYGVEDLTGVATDDLRGPNLTVALWLERF